jgi:flavin reductase
VNLLNAGQQAQSDIFAGRTPSDVARFDRVDWQAGQGGQPVLAGAAANFECTLKSTLLWETHHVLIGQVSAVHLSDNPDALLYGQRSYRRAVGMTDPV